MLTPEQSEQVRAALGRAGVEFGGQGRVVVTGVQHDDGVFDVEIEVSFSGTKPHKDVFVVVAEAFTDEDRTLMESLAL